MRDEVQARGAMIAQGGMSREAETRAHGIGLLGWQSNEAGERGTGVV